MNEYNVENNKLPGIQFLRAIAALMVVFYHLNGYLKEFKFSAEFIDHIGYSGVDLFFVISGFIIAYTSYEKLGDIDQVLVFWKKRFVRIYPNYWLCISLAMIFNYLFNNTLLNLENLNKKAILLLPISMHENFMGSLWTLSYEIYFYFIFSLFIAFISKANIYKTLLIWFIASICIQYNYSLNLPFYQSFFFSPLQIEFIIGAFAAIFIKQKKIISPIISIILGILCLIFLQVYFEYNNKPLWHGRNFVERGIFYGLGYGFIVYAFSFLKDDKNIFKKALIYLGDASYTLYLFHLLIIILLQKLFIWMKKASIFPLEIIGILYFVSALACIISYSLIHFKYVEQPITKYLNNKIKYIKFWKILTRPAS